MFNAEKIFLEKIDCLLDIEFYMTINIFLYYIMQPRLIVYWVILLWALLQRFFL